MDGLKKVNKYNIHIHEDSTNIQDEANKYKYKTDPKTGEVLDITIKLFDDAWDAIRYCILAYGWNSYINFCIFILSSRADN